MRSVDSASAITQGEMGSSSRPASDPDATRFDLVVLHARHATLATSAMPLRCEARRQRPGRLVPN
jgi:hypothetical protein